jgi:hypothetical protein
MHLVIFRRGATAVEPGTESVSKLARLRHQFLAHLFKWNSRQAGLYTG